MLENKNGNPTSRAIVLIHLHTAPRVIFKHVNWIMSCSHLKPLHVFPLFSKQSQMLFHACKTLYGCQLFQAYLLLLPLDPKAQALWPFSGRPRKQIALSSPSRPQALFSLLLSGLFLLSLEVTGPMAPPPEVLLNSTIICSPLTSLL